VPGLYLSLSRANGSPLGGALAALRRLATSGFGGVAGLGQGGSVDQ